MKNLMLTGLLAMTLTACSSGDETSPAPVSPNDAFTQTVAATAATAPDESEPKDVGMTAPSESETAEPVELSVP